MWHVQQSGVPASNAGVVAGNFSLSGDRWNARSNALIAGADGGRWSVQGRAAASLTGGSSDAMARMARMARWELTGLLGTFTRSGELPTSSGEVLAGGRLGSAHGGLSAGVGVGATANNRRVLGLLHAQADTWVATTAGQYGADVSVFVAQSRSGGDSLAAGTNKYADLSLVWRHEGAGLSTGLLTGVREENTHPGRPRMWAAADIAAWVTSRAALVVGAGRSLEDAIRGVPATRYVSAGVRLGAQPQVTVRQRRQGKGGVRLDVRRSDDRLQRIDVHVGSAQRVDLMGDFTDWSAIHLDRVGGSWQAAHAISSGLHRVLVRIDGGDWTVPANLQRVVDDLGGAVGLITVP